MNTHETISKHDLKWRSANQIDRLDTLRAISIVIVVVFHFYPTFLPWGYIGVDIFFTLSGFLMSYLYFQSSNNPDHSSTILEIISSTDHRELDNRFDSYIDYGAVSPS